MDDFTRAMEIMRPPVPMRERSRPELYERVEKANSLLKLIASTDRKFFHSNFEGAGFTVVRNRVGYKDAKTGRVLWQFINNKAWTGFSEGDSMQFFVKDLVKYIRTGKECYRNLKLECWGYSEENIKLIIAKMNEIDFSNQEG